MRRNCFQDAGLKFEFMNERDPDGGLLRPQFHSEVPDFLLKNCTPAERWQCEQQSIASQQNEWLITQALSADQRQFKLEKQMLALETLRLVVSSKWSLVVWLFIAILVPVALVIIGSGLTAWFETKLRGQ